MHTHTHRGFEFDEIPESDKLEFAEWLEGIRFAEEEQEQEQLEQQQALESSRGRTAWTCSEVVQTGGRTLREGFLRNTFRVAGS